MLSEYEYGDPYEGEDDWSSTPPPQCDDPAEHQVCVPPAWGRGSPALQLAVDVFCAMKRVAIMLSGAFNV